MDFSPFTIRVALVTRSGFPFATAVGPVGGTPKVKAEPDAGDPESTHAVFTGYDRDTVERVLTDAWNHADADARQLVST